MDEPWTLELSLLAIWHKLWKKLVYNNVTNAFDEIKDPTFPYLSLEIRLGEQAQS